MMLKRLFRTRYYYGNGVTTHNKTKLQVEAARADPRASGFSRSTMGFHARVFRQQRPIDLYELDAPDRIEPSVPASTTYCAH